MAISRFVIHKEIASFTPRKETLGTIKVISRKNFLPILVKLQETVEYVDIFQFCLKKLYRNDIFQNN
jgi:hypothetical protein